MYKENLHNEQELLLLVSQGDQQAYQQLFDGYWDQVYGTGLHLTKSPEQAKDLAQDIFLKLWDHRKKLPEVKNFRSWLYIIARNLIHDQIRTKIFHESNKLFLSSYFAYMQEAPYKALENKELNIILQDAIRELPLQLRQVFILHRLEGLSHNEISHKLDITLLTSKTYMVRALILLRQLLKDHAQKLLTLLFFWSFIPRK